MVASLTHVLHVLKCGEVCNSLRLFVSKYTQRSTKPMYILASGSISNKLLPLHSYDL